MKRLECNLITANNCNNDTVNNTNLLFPFLRIVQNSCQKNMTHDNISQVRVTIKIAVFYLESNSNQKYYDKELEMD